jgi:hypothetical protein
MIRIKLYFRTCKSLRGLSISKVHFLAELMWLHVCSFLGMFFSAMKYKLLVFLLYAYNSNTAIIICNTCCCAAAPMQV